MAKSKITPVPTYTAGKPPSGYAPGGIATAIKKTAAPKVPAASGYSGSPLYDVPNQYPTGTIGSVLGGNRPQSASDIVTSTRTVTPMQVYQDEILGNDQAVAAQGIYNTTLGNLANTRAYGINQALFKGGWTPDTSTGPLAGFASDITPSSLAEAMKNPMSAKAQLDLQLGQAKTNLPYDLAASGAGRSGARAIELGNLSRSYDLASYQGLQDEMAQILSAINAYTGGAIDAQNALEAARRQVADTLARQAGYSESIVTSPGGGDESYWPQPENP